MNATHRALSRALSFCCGSESFVLDLFLHRATFELCHTLPSDVAALSLVLKHADGTCFVGRSREHPPLPAATLLGFLVEQSGDKMTCRVRDHALDTLRFIDSRFRTSIIVAIEIPKQVTSGAEGGLWFGLLGGASSETIAKAEAMGRDISEWLAWYGPVLEANTRAALESQQERARVSELVSLVHDARAPLGVLKYLARESGHAESNVLLRREIEYLERVLMQGAPRGVSMSQEPCDVREVVSRVYRRHVHEFGAARLRVEQGYMPVYVHQSDLDIERILTNLVSNACRHAPDSNTVISVEERGGSVILSVRDNGAGISPNIIDAIESGVAIPRNENSGWGIGLQNCVSKVKSLGGDLTIASRERVGTKITITFPLAPAPVGRQGMELFDGGVMKMPAARAVDIFVVDDDADHSASFARILRDGGFVVQEYSTIEKFLEKFTPRATNVILCDAHMPDGGAERLLSLLASRKQSSRFAVVSGDASDEYLYKLAALGAQAFFAKPVQIDEILGWIRGLLALEEPASTTAE